MTSAARNTAATTNDQPGGRSEASDAAGVGGSAIDGATVLDGARTASAVGLGGDVGVGDGDGLGVGVGVGAALGAETSATGRMETYLPSQIIGNGSYRHGVK